MKVVMMLNHFPRFTETFIVNKFLGLMDRGWDVYVICNMSDPVQWELYPQLQPRSEFQSRVHVKADRDAVLGTLRVLKPDLVHFEFGRLTLGRMDIKDLLGCKVVVSFRGPDLSIYGLGHPDCYEDVWQRADALHFVSHDLWQRARRLNCPTDKSHVIIPPAINTVFFDPVGRRHTDIAGGPERPMRILSVGHVHWVKGYEYALQAVKLLVNQGIQCEYRIIGDGDYKAAVLFTVHDLGIENVVRLLGFQPSSEVKNNMLWADVLLHAAVLEGACNAALEAQAMALPVVCTDAGGLPEIVVNMETGFVVPRRDPQALSEKLYVLSQNAALRQRMGEAGRRWVETNFRLEDQISHLDRLYRQVLELPTEPQTKSIDTLKRA